MARNEITSFIHGRGPLRTDLFDLWVLRGSLFNVRTGIIFPSIGMARSELIFFVHGFGP